MAVTYAQSSVFIQPHLIPYLIYLMHWLTFVASTKIPDADSFREVMFIFGLWFQRV